MGRIFNTAIIVCGCLVICYFVIWRYMYRNITVKALYHQSISSCYSLNAIESDRRQASAVDSFRAEPYQRDNTNCSIHMTTNKKLFEYYFRKTGGSSKHCTLHYFNQYLQDHKQFLGEGVWFAPPNGTPSVEADFYPKGCTFSKHLSNANSLNKCFLKKGVKKILLTGDSNSAMMKKRLLNYFQGFNLTGRKTCRALDVSDSSADYFLVPGITKDMIKVKLASKKDMCALPNNSSIIIERTSMLHILDGSIHVEESENLTSRFFPRIYHAETKLEYLLKYYLPHKGFPDLWLFTLPFHHESWGNTADKIRIDLRYMLDMLSLYLPNTTTIVFVADARECPQLRPPDVGKEFEAFWNKSRNEYIHDLNQVLYEVLGQRLPGTKNMYGFLDADKISCPIVCSWHADGGHMTSEWYVKMARYILESFCEGDQ